jgi:hypothetical protein
VRIEGLDKYENFFGAILHPAGNIAEELLKAGLARVADWSCSFMKREAVLAMKVSERGAKQARIRMWKDYNPGGGGATHSAAGKVIEVFSGDTIYVATGPGGAGNKSVAIQKRQEVSFLDRVCLIARRVSNGHTNGHTSAQDWSNGFACRVCAHQGWAICARGWLTHPGHSKPRIGSAGCALARQCR